MKLEEILRDSRPMLLLIRRGRFACRPMKNCRSCAIVCRGRPTPKSKKLRFRILISDFCAEMRTEAGSCWILRPTGKTTGPCREGRNQSRVKSITPDDLQRERKSRNAAAENEVVELFHENQNTMSCPPVTIPSQASGNSSPSQPQGKCPFAYHGSTTGI